MTHSHPVFELFTNRRTIRSLRPEPLAPGDLERIIEAGQRAPSGGLGQIYSVIRVSDTGLRERLAGLAGSQQHIRDAAEFFIFCVDVHRARRLLEHRGGTYEAGPRIAVHYGTMDALLLAANMATMAEALGYGTCFIGALLNKLDAVARELELPPGVLPVVGLTVGVPAEDQAPPKKPRLPRDIVFHENTYQEPSTIDLEAAFQAMGETWHETLRRYFSPDGVFSRREVVWQQTLVQQGFKTGTESRG